MAIFLSTIALCVAVVALCLPRRSLPLDKLIVGRGRPDRVTIEPGLVKFFHGELVGLALGVNSDGTAHILGGSEAGHFGLHAEADDVSVVLQSGDDTAVVQPNGITVLNKSMKSTLLASAMMSGLPLSAGNEAARIEAKPSKQIEPMKPLAKLRHKNANALKLHDPADDESNA